MLGLFHALQAGKPVLLIFIFDTEILEQLPKEDARVTFIDHNSLQSINKDLQSNYNSSIAMYHAKPIDVYKKLAESVYYRYGVYQSRL